MDTGPPLLSSDFGKSPWLSQRKYLEHRARRLRAAGHALTVVLETNRGCPYGCTFCDWGSSTLGKIRTIDVDRVTEEIEWLAEAQVDTIWIADANFGILARDAEIAERIASVHERTGWPRQVHMFPAKNRARGVLAATLPLVRAGLLREFAIGVQSTDRTTLQTIARRNMPPGEQTALVEALTAEGVGVEAQLIIGCPGDTVARWRRTLADVMESGLHSEIWIFWFEVLANAPANDPNYRHVHGLETRVRVPEGGGPARPVVCASTTFEMHEYVEMHAYGATVRALHYGGATRFIALYLRFARGVPFADFYAAVYDDLLCGSAMLERARAAIHAFFEPGSVDSPLLVRYEERDYSVMLAPCDFVLVSVLRGAGTFYRNLEVLLAERWGADAMMEDLLRYQQHMMITFDYVRATGRSFTIEHDWPSWFRACERSWTRPDTTLPPPTGLTAAVVHAFDRAAGPWGEEPLDWHEGSTPSTALDRYVAHVSARGLKHRNYFRDVRVDSPSALGLDPGTKVPGEALRG